MCISKKTGRPITATALVVGCILMIVSAATADDAVKVNVDNFVRAETAAQIDRGLKQTQGINKWAHNYEPIPLDGQNVVRMNRDTLYSYAVVDISMGATLTLPDSGKRYMSVMVINEDHYMKRVFHKKGTYKLTQEEFDTPYVIVTARTLANANDPGDIKKANALQDKLLIQAVSSTPYTHPNYDKASYDATFKALVDLSTGLPDTKNTFGDKDEVTETRHLIGTAYGYGGLPEHEAFYIIRSEPHQADDFQFTVKNVPVDGFWSISIYNKDGFFEKNKFNSYSLNNLTAEPNNDGSITINFGTDPEGKKNFLYVMDGWNYAIRLYQPRKEFLDGKWAFPAIQPIK